VENTAYGSSICAESSALLRANSLGERSFLQIAIIAQTERLTTEEITAPCGPCRQMIYEFAQVGGQDIEIIIVNARKNKVIKTKIS